MKIDEIKKELERMVNSFEALAEEATINSDYMQTDFAQGLEKGRGIGYRITTESIKKLLKNIG